MKTKNKFLIKSYITRDLLVYKDIIKISSTNFFNEILINFASPKNNKFFILLKVKYKDGSILTYHKGVIVNKNSLADYLEFLNHILEFKSDNYKEEDDYNEIIFNYLPIPHEREHQFNESKWIDLTKKEIVKLKLSNFNNYKLPQNNNYLTWGKIFVNNVNGNNEFMVIKGNNYNYAINTVDGINYSITLFPRSPKTVSI
jgi:hypothetical protein